MYVPFQTFRLILPACSELTQTVTVDALNLLCFSVSRSVFVYESCPHLLADRVSYKLWIFLRRSHCALDLAAHGCWWSWISSR